MNPLSVESVQAPQVVVVVVDVVVVVVVVIVAVVVVGVAVVRQQVGIELHVIGHKSDIA